MKMWWLKGAGVGVWSVLASAWISACCCPPDIPEPDRDLREQAEKEARQDDQDDSDDGELDEQTLSARGNREVSSFTSSKRLIMDVYKGREETFYCGCRFTQKKKIDHKSCGYKPRKNKSRASRLEIEHVVPAAAFGANLPSWRDGHPDCNDSKGQPYQGRRCATKISKLFSHMEADLYNLQPAIGEVNGDRSDYDMAIIPGEAREYGECDVEIEDQKVEPRESIRGDIARTYFYMDWAYPGLGIVNDGNRKMLKAWDKADPIDAAERARAAEIRKLQKNENPFIK